MLKCNASQLKIIAIIGMLLNHMVFGWWDILPPWLAAILYATGGLTFPILAYFVVEGYRHTSNLKRYVLRILLFGVIAMPFHAMVFGAVGLNIMFTIALSIWVLYLNDRIQKRAWFWIIFVIACLFSVLFAFDWAVIGLVVVLLAHRIQDEQKRRVIPPIVAGVVNFVMTALVAVSLSDPEVAAVLYAKNSMMTMTYAFVAMTFIFGCFFAAVLLKNFNGERGKSRKWLFYAFYPLHLAFIAAVAVALGIFGGVTFLL